MSENASSSRTSFWSDPNKRDQMRLPIEFLGFVAVLLTLTVTSCQTQRSIAKSAEAVQESRRQLDQSTYQAVYEQQLSLWNLAAENEDLAPFIVGGRRPGDEVGKAEETSAARSAAIIQSLDFYAYVYEQLAPRRSDGTPYPLALDGVPPPPTNQVSYSEWEEWIAWSNTIVSGFQGAPGMCENLMRNEDDYSNEFVQEVMESGACA